MNSITIQVSISLLRFPKSNGRIFAGYGHVWRHWDLPRWLPWIVPISHPWHIYIYVHNFDIQNASNLCLLYHQPEFCGFQPKLFRIILFCRAEVGSRTCRPSEQCYDSPYGPSGLKTSWRSLISGKRHGTIWYSTLYWVNFITTSLFSLTGTHS